MILQDPPLAAVEQQVPGAHEVWVEVYLAAGVAARQNHPRDVVGEAEPRVEVAGERGRPPRALQHRARGPAPGGLQHYSSISTPTRYCSIYLVLFKTTLNQDFF